MLTGLIAGNGWKWDVLTSDWQGPGAKTGRIKFDSSNTRKLVLSMERLYAVSSNMVTQA